MKYARVLATVSVGTLVGCTPMSMVTAPADPGAVRTTQAGPRKATPSRVSSGSVSDVAELYRAGRLAQDAGDFAQAEARYTQVLAAWPRHAEALNALGVIRASSGRMAEAIELFSRALAAAPQAAHIHNNLGYALLLAGRLQEAEQPLRRSLALNPASTQTRHNIEQLQQAQAGAATTLASADPETEPAGEARLVALAPNIYEVQDAPGGAAKAQAAAPQASSAQLLAGVRLEVSNGVGIRHMARRTAQRLAKLGLVTARLTNQPGYRQIRTEIQFGTGQQHAAEALSTRLPMTPHTTPGSLAPNVQMRLVLGHDQVGKAIAAWIDAEGSQRMSVQAATGQAVSGWMLG